MILGSDAIRAALISGEIVCDPAPVRIEGAHIDVTLGGDYWTPRVRDDVLEIARFDPYDLYELNRNAHFTPNDVPLKPQSVTLCHTIEFIGTTVPHLVPMLETRSTLARWGISIHASAGVGDPGFSSRWTLEIFNPHRMPVVLPVGARVGSISFQRVEGNGELYEGRYNVGRDEWTAEAMLPRRGNLK